MNCAQGLFKLQMLKRLTLPVSSTLNDQGKIDVATGITFFPAN